MNAFLHYPFPINYISSPDSSNNYIISFIFQNCIMIFLYLLLKLMDYLFQHTVFFHLSMYWKKYTVENSIKIPQKKKKKLPYDPATAQLSIHLKKTETLIAKVCTFVFTTALFTTGKIWKQPKYPSTDEWIKKI